jgi:hypothetical protein
MKNTIFSNFRKIIMITALFILIFGCKKSAKNNSVDGLNMNVKWTFNLDNNSLSWTGNYSIDETTFDYTCTSNEKGVCDQQLGGEQYSVRMSKGNGTITTSSDFNAYFNCTIFNKIGSANITTANSPLSLSNYSCFEIQTSNFSCSASLPNSNITVYVTEIIPNSTHTALVKGNFSGVIGKYGGGVVNISGSFEAYNKY